MAYDFGQPFRGYQPAQGGFPYQPTNYPPVVPNAPMPQQNGQGWGYMPPVPPQETELDLLRQILQKLDEIQKGMVKNVSNE